MERIWAQSSGQDSYDPYTCAVQSALFLECLDIGSARTLGGSLSDSLAYNMSTSAGDLNNNFYAVLALEGLVNMSSTDTAILFGGDAPCNGKLTGDGAVNAYDMAVLMWYQFKFEPYDLLPLDPALVTTVRGRDDTGQRCALGESRRMWQLAIGNDYCHSGSNAQELGYSTSARRALKAKDQSNHIAQLLSNTVLAAYTHSSFGAEEEAHWRRQLEHAESLANDIEHIDANVETRSPTARRADINHQDMLRGINSMRTLDTDISEWAVVSGYGRWFRIRSPGVQVATELYLTGVSTDRPVHLSLQPAPAKNCTACPPADDDPRDIVVAFARRSEYVEQYASALQLKSQFSQPMCATIVPAVVQSHAMIGNTIALRQQPPNRACSFDIFLWIPEFPLPGVHVTRMASPFSFAARRLAAVGAESAVGANANAGCTGEIGILPGSSAMDGFRGLIQRSITCARYDYTSGVSNELVGPSDEAEDDPAMCAAVACSVLAPSYQTVAQRSFHLFASSGMESAYSNAISTLSSAFTDEHLPAVSGAVFDKMLQRSSLGPCCAGYQCMAPTGSAAGADPICIPVVLPPPSPSPSPSPSPDPPASPPPSAPHSPPPLAIVAVQVVVFNATVEEDISTFDEEAYIANLAQTLDVQPYQITLHITPASIIVQATIRPPNSAVLEQTTPQYAEALKDTINTVFHTANATSASTLLQVAVTNVSPAVIVEIAEVVQYSHHSPPSPPPDGKVDAWVFILAGGVILVVLLWFFREAIYDLAFDESNVSAPRVGRATPAGSERASLLAITMPGNHRTPTNRNSLLTGALLPRATSEVSQQALPRPRQAPTIRRGARPALRNGLPNEFRFNLLP